MCGCQKERESATLETLTDAKHQAETLSASEWVLWWLQVLFVGHSYQIPPVYIETPQAPFVLHVSSVTVDARTLYCVPLILPVFEIFGNAD